MRASGTRRSLPQGLATGSAAILLACLCFGSNSILVKLVSSRIDPWTMSFVRFAAGLVFSASAVAAVAMRGGSRPAEGFKVRDFKSLALRSVFGCAQMILFFIGVALTSSGRATLLMCTHPIFAALFGLALFGERLPKAVFIGVLAGFAGAAIVFWDGSAYSLAGNLISLAGGACNGMAVHFVKRLRRDHGPFLVYLGPCVLGLILTAFSAPRLGSVSLGDLGILVLIGLVSFLGQILNTWGLKFLPATAGAMLGLSEVIFAVSLSAIILDESMPPLFFIGAAVLLSGLAFTAILANGKRKAG
jgi:drug/metabolite transporter (DMT)-like permease